MFDTVVLRTTADKALLRSQKLSKGFLFFSPDLMEHRTYIAVCHEGTVVGLVALVEDSRRIPGAMGIGFVETHAKYRRRGVARLLVEKLFQLAREMGKSLANTHYELDGQLWLRPMMEAAAVRYPDVALYER